MELIKSIIVSLIKTVLIVFTVFPIKRNKIIFYPTNGKYYCNLKYISQYLEKNCNEIKVIWIVKDNNANKFSCKKNTISFFYHVMTSKIIVFNNGFINYIPKRKNQIYIETWHGGGAYKKIGAVYKNIKNKYKRKRVLDAINNIDYIISSCNGFEKAFKEDTGVQKSIFLNTGMPRNDIFFYKTKIKEATDKVYERYHIKISKKIVLYAPTFRDHGFKNDLDIKLLINSLTKKFGNEYVLMLRCHPHIINRAFKEYKENDNIINVSLYPDMQELLCAADILITDYSSCMWDFSLMYKPCFIYANDLKDYKIERNFHTPIKEWPFPVAVNNEELRNNILNFNQDDYIKKVKQHHKLLGSFEKGTATKDVCKLIVNICNSNSKE